jgi:hypothetical protein
LLQTIFAARQTAEAEEHQSLVSKYRQVILGYPLIPALKTIIARMRVDPAWKNVQPPLSSLPEFELEGLLEKLTAAGFRLAGVNAQD